MEALLLYNLLWDIYKNTKHLREGFINIFCNISKVVIGINSGLAKTTETIQDGGVLISGYIEIIRKMTIKVFIE